MSRVLLGVRGMDSDAAAGKVKETLLALGGVSKVETSPHQQAAVEYDDQQLTIMDLLRALRQIGFVAGME